MKKVCIKCNIEKELIEFYIKGNTCKDCKKQYFKTYKDVNKDKVYKKCREWNLKNKEKIKEYTEIWINNNKEKHKNIKNKAFKKFISVPENREKRKKYDKKYKKSLRDSNIDFKLKDNIQSMISYHIHKKISNTLKYLGCSIQEYKLHLEKQFDENMTWENYGTYWEIDHIIPLSKNGSFHYTNTQPLTITENRKKSNKL